MGLPPHVLPTSVLPQTSMLPSPRTPVLLGVRRGNPAFWDSTSAAYHFKPGRLLARGHLGTQATPPRLSPPFGRDENEEKNGSCSFYTS